MKTMYSTTMASIKWYNTCYMCTSPLDLLLCIKEKQLRKFYTYCKFKPMNFMTNCSFLKVVGLHQRTLCLNCYALQKYKLVPGPRQVRHRELTGRGKIVESSYATLTVKQIHDWFFDFRDFCNRTDLDEILMEEKIPHVRGLHVIKLRE